MNGVVAPEIAATAPQERGWRRFVLALVLMVAVTAAPGWPPSLALFAGAIRLLLPVEEFALLVLVAIAVASVIGWWMGGRWLPALLWTVAAGYVLWMVPLSVSGYGAFVRGWALSLGAAFGLVCLMSRSRPLLSRALAAVALAGSVTLVGFASRTTGSSGVLDNPQQMLSVEYQRRLGDTLDAWRDREVSEGWQAFVSRFPEAGDRAARMERLLVFLAAPQSAPRDPQGFVPGPLLSIAPALLALESLLALALGWAAYHRLARVRVGPPLEALRNLRFNDQLVWGLIVGFTMVLLPTLVTWRAVGANLLCFFGALYAFRGAGVLSWMIPDRYAVPALIALVVLVPVLGPVWVLAATLVITLVLGLGDTWRDFRAGAQPRRQRPS